jgi:hypothetical protein
VCAWMNIVARSTCCAYATARWLVPTHTTAPPTCLLCDAATTELESPSLRTTWAEHEGVCWAWHTDTAAYWLLCLSCHRAAWPMDRRCGNRHSKPWCHMSQQRSVRGGMNRLVSGDFYTTMPPPETLQAPFEVLRRERNVKKATTSTGHSDAGRAADSSVCTGQRVPRMVRRVDVGEAVVAPRVFQKRGPRGPCSFREASVREDIVPVPFVDKKDRGPFYTYKDVCDSCCSALSSPDACIRMYVLHPVEAMGEGAVPRQLVHQGYFCARCNTQLMYGCALPLAPGVQDDEGGTVYALAHWSDGAARRVEVLRRCDAPYTPKKR